MANNSNNKNKKKEETLENEKKNIELLTHWLDYDSIEETILDWKDSENKFILYGWDNLLPQRFVDYYRKSPTFSAIINKKVYYTAGNSIEYNSERLKEWAKKQDFGNGLHSLINKLAFDYWLQGGFCIQVVHKPHWNAVDSLHHQDWAKCRIGFEPLEDGSNEHQQVLWISNDWRRENSGDPYTGKVPKPLYNWEYNSQPSYFYYRSYTPEGDWYPLPDYFAASDAIETEISVQRYKKNSVQGGFKSDGILKVPSDVNPQIMEQINKQLKKMTGSEGKRNFIVFPQGNSDQEIQIEWIPLDTSPDKNKAEETIEEARQAIITGCGLPSPTVVGLPNTGGLTSNAETIQIGMAEFKKQLTTAQNVIADRINELIKKAGFDPEGKDAWQIEQNMPQFNSSQTEMSKQEDNNAYL